MKDTKLLIMDLTVTIVLIVIGCFVGKTMLDKYNTWISFNGPIIGILLLGVTLVVDSEKENHRSYEGEDI